MCWSHDQTKLVSILVNHSTGSASLGILDLNSKQTRAVAINVDQRPMVISQCWSQNDKKLVSKGTDPTWSPEGEWIAFRDRDAYYAIHPNGTGRKKLFHNYWGGAVSALYWSPDSRIVAYVRELDSSKGAPWTQKSISYAQGA